MPQWRGGLLALYRRQSSSHSNEPMALVVVAQQSNKGVSDCSPWLLILPVIPLSWVTPMRYPVSGDCISCSGTWIAPKEHRRCGHRAPWRAARTTRGYGSLLGEVYLPLGTPYPSLQSGVALTHNISDISVEVWPYLSPLRSFNEGQVV